MNHTGILLALLSIAAISVSACGGAAVPHDQVASSKAAIRAAEEVGASGQPQAELHLRYAKDELAKAQALIADGDNEEASRVLMRAQADAELAIALSKETTARAEAQQAMQQVQMLRQRVQ